MLKLSVDDVKKIVWLSERGWSCCRIGNLLGVTSNAVHYWRKRAGFELPYKMVTKQQLVDIAYKCKQKNKLLIERLKILQGMGSD